MLKNLTFGFYPDSLYVDSPTSVLSFRRSYMRICVLTSIRDIALCDRNGEMVHTRDGSRYMKGSLEHLVLATLPGGRLYGLTQVVGVVTDDMDKDLGGYPKTPTLGGPWIHPFGLRGPEGMLVRDVTTNIPSNFRALPLSDQKGREVAKEEFERKVLEFMVEREADILLSDHYMARIDHLWAWIPRRVLNIHPGVTVPGHPYAFRGKTPTADAISRAKNEVGVRTGATIHFVDGEIDHGPVISFLDITPVYGTDQPEELRYRNYQMAKLPVLIDGLVNHLV
ncbi:MAG: hypothetical protein M3M85_01065 [bacterium]|nr:hypothetical protein [bacterium]